MASLSNNAFLALQEPKFANSTHLNGFFIGRTGNDFIDWFNKNLAGKGTFVNRKISPDLNKGEDMMAVKREFAEFWDSIPLVFKQSEITLFDFAALMCIAINETSGRFRSVTELCGRGAKDKNGVRHEGLAYAFDLVRGVKKSYNTLAGNKSAFDCFSNPVFCAAHRGLGLSDVLSAPSQPDKVDPVWKGDVYPSGKFPVIEDLAVTGFVMQADFYKFRGRGPIQITGRPPYKRIAQFIQNYDGPSDILQKYKARWQSLSADDACYVSNDMDWDEIFTVKSIVALSLRLYADLAVPSKNMFIMSQDFDVLNANTRQTGSIWSVGRIISGIEKYANEEYKPRVVEMLEKIAEQVRQRI